jgi:lipopolysaccharide export system permease protein
MRFRIIDRYIARELLLGWMAITAILIMVLLSAFIGDYLGDVAAGSVPPNIMVSIVALRLVRAMTLVLPVAFFLSMLLTFGRLYADNEMAVLNACGIGQGNLLRPVAWLAVPAAIFMGLLSLWLAPLASYHYYLVRDEAARSLEVAGLMPGRFQALGGEDTVLYAQSVDSTDGRLDTVFVHAREDDRDVIIRSRSAWMTETDDGVRYLRFADGEQVQGLPGEAPLRRLRFAEGRLQLRQPDDGGVLFKRDSIDTTTLLNSQDPGEQGELHLRFAPPVVLLVLALIAVPLSRTSPRQGRYGRLMLGIFVYLLYSNTLNIAQVWVSTEKVPAALGMWWVHAIFALAGGFALAMQLRRRRSASSMVSA